MMVATPSVSQRLLRKGSLVDETYRLFQAWQDHASIEDNFDRVLGGQFRSTAWGNEVKMTLQRRFRDIESARALIELARGGYPLDEWRACLLLWIATQDSLYRDFAVNWLFPEYVAGRLQVRTENVVEHVRNAWAELNPASKPLTRYGSVRTARDLIRMARDLGVLAGDGPAKGFSALHFSDDLLVYFCQVIADTEGATSRIPSSTLWRVLLLDPGHVHELLLRLHQYRKMRYDVAGSLTQITLPFGSAFDCARSMVS